MQRRMSHHSRTPLAAACSCADPTSPLAQEFRLPAPPPLVPPPPPPRSRSSTRPSTAHGSPTGSPLLAGEGAGGGGNRSRAATRAGVGSPRPSGGGGGRASALLGSPGGNGDPWELEDCPPAAPGAPPAPPCTWSKALGLRRRHHVAHKHRADPEPHATMLGSDDSRANRSRIVQERLQQLNACKITCEQVAVVPKAAPGGGGAGFLAATRPSLQPPGSRRVSVTELASHGGAAGAIGLGRRSRTSTMFEAHPTAAGAGGGGGGMVPSAGAVLRGIASVPMQFIVPNHHMFEGRATGEDPEPLPDLPPVVATSDLSAVAEAGKDGGRIEGFLAKRPLRVRAGGLFAALQSNTWKRRFFIGDAEDCTLSYSADPTSPPINTLRVSSRASVERYLDHPFAFKLCLGDAALGEVDGAVLYAAAPDLPTMHTWMAFVSGMIDTAKVREGIVAGVPAPLVTTAEYTAIAALPPQTRTLIAAATAAAAAAAAGATVAAPPPAPPGEWRPAG
jgi:hypothetical protein